MADTSLYFDFLKRRDTVTPHMRKVATSATAMASALRVSTVISYAAITLLIAGFAGLIAHAIALVAALAPMLNLIGLIPVAALGAAAGIGTLIIATKGLGTALQEGAKGAEAYKKLTKAGKELVDALRAQKSRWEDLQRTVQKATFRRVGHDIRTLAALWLPMLKVQLAGMGQAWNVGFRNFAKLAKSKDFVKDVNVALGFTAAFMRRLALAWAPVISGFRHFAVVGATFLPGIGNWVREIAIRFDRWARAARESGKMAGWFATGLGVLRNFWIIVKNIGASIAAIFRAGNPAGYLGSWIAGTAALREWLESAEGQRKVSEALTTLRNVASMLVGVLAQLAVGLTTILAEGTSVSDSMAVLGVVSGFLADHLDELALVLPYLTALFLGFKTMQAVSMATAAASIPITIMQSIVMWKHTRALQANTRAMMAQTGATRRGIIAGIAHRTTTVANTVATTTATVATKVWTATTKAAAAASMLFTSAGRKAIATSIATRAAIIGATIATMAAAVATKVITAAQWLWNAAMMANPLGLIILAIIAVIAIIVLLWTKSAGFRNFFIGLWNHIWSFLKMIGSWFAGPFKNFFVNAWNGLIAALRAFNTFWINVWNGAIHLLRSFNTKVVGVWNAIIGFFKGLPGRIGGAVKGIWNGLVSSFRNAINNLIRMWNNFSLTLGGGSVLGFSIPSITLDTPNIPYLDVGGRVLETGIAVVHRGEHVIPSGAAMAGGNNYTINIHGVLGNPRETGRLVVESIKAYERANTARWRQ